MAIRFTHLLQRGLLLARVPDVGDEDDRLEDDGEDAVEQEGGEQVLVDGDPLDPEHPVQKLWKKY